MHYAPDGIRANAVCRGVDGHPAPAQRGEPDGHMGDAWDVAHASLFLASDEAKYITGVCLPVDGGKSCWGR